jgi:uncharacterized membrane protein
MQGRRFETRGLNVRGSLVSNLRAHAYSAAVIFTSYATCPAAPSRGNGLSASLIAQG